MIKKTDSSTYVIFLAVINLNIGLISCGIPFPFPDIALPITDIKTEYASSPESLITEEIVLTCDNEESELKGFKVYYKDSNGFLKPAVLYWKDAATGDVHYVNDYIHVEALQLQNFNLQPATLIFYYVKDAPNGYYPDPNETTIIRQYSIFDDAGNSISSLYEPGEKIYIYFVPMVYMPQIGDVVAINAFGSAINRTEVVFTN